MRHCVKLVELQLIVRLDVDVCALVLGGVAVLGRGEDGNASPVVLDFVAFHADFVTSDDGLEVVLLAEALRDVWSELQAHAPL